MGLFKNFYLILLIAIIASASSLSDYRLEHVIKAGLYENPPLSYGDEKNPNGIFVDILKYIADKNGLDIVFVKCKFSKCLDLLKNNSIDILAPIAKSKERSKYIDFLNVNILSNWGVIYAKKEKLPKSIIDVNHKKIGVLKNDIYIKGFNGLSKDFNLLNNYVLFDSYKEIFDAIKSNKVDAGIASRLIFLSLKDKYPDIYPSTIYFDPVNITFAINKNDKKLKDIFNKEIKKLKDDKGSKLYLILSSYLNETKLLRPIISKILLIVSILLILILLSFLVILYFKKEVNKKIAHIKKEKNKAEKLYKESSYLNKIISMAKNINQILIEPVTPEKKMDIICRELTKDNFFDFAWIGFVQNGTEIKLTNHSGIDKNIQFNFSSLALSKSLKNYDNKTLIIKHNETDKNIKTEDFALLNQIYRKICKFNHTLLTPIKLEKDKEPIAFLGVHTTKQEGFSDKEISLLEELAGDIGMMLNNNTLKEKNKKLLYEKIEDYKSFIDSLVKAIEARDPYTAGHSKRVSEYSIKIAKALSFDKHQIDTLKIAAKVHDIGKIAIPDSILLKPGKLNDNEYSIIKKHSEMGYDILKNLQFFKDEAFIIKQHHERYDGSGYPQGLKQGQINPLATILAIADTFDAMTTDRIYKAGKTKSEALEELSKLNGIWFEPNICKTAIKTLEEIDLEESLPQLPSNELDEARFAYFFTDQLTGLYNYKYLDFYTHFAKYFLSSTQHAIMIEIHHFSRYNEKYGWKEGNNLLIHFSEILKKIFRNEKIFRIRGDDFLIIFKNQYTPDDLKSIKSKLEEMTKDVSIEIDTIPIKVFQNEEMYKQWSYTTG